MTVYFRLRCFSDEWAVRVMVASHIVVGCLGVVHWGYCGLMGKLVALYSDPKYLLSAQADQIQALYNSPIAFFAIAGIQQVAVSVGLILLALSYLGEANRDVWRRVALGLLVFDFAFNFTIAVSASMSTTYYFQLYKQFLDNADALLNGYLHDFVITLRDFINYSIAEAVLTWVITLPVLAATLAALLDHSLKEEGQNPEAHKDPVSTIQIHHK